MKYKINLLSPKKEDWGKKISFFLINYLRYVIVLTQLVVIGVFFYKIQIEQRIIDLKESVNQKKEIIKIVLPLLKEAEYIDNKSKEIKKIVKRQTALDKRLNYFIGVLPEDANLKTFRMNNQVLEIEGIVKNPGYLQNFLNFLKKDGFFKNVSLKSIKKTDEGYNFFILLD